jgi:signal transduction histidine kinase
LLALFPLAVLAVVEPMRARLTRSQLATERHEKLASLGVLAAGVAHEIRNPLTAIKCRLFSLKKDFGPALAGSEDFATLNREMDRLERIVRAFLDFARPPEPRIAALPAQAALDHVRKVLSPEFVKRNVSLELEVDDKLTLAADRQQLEQVLINLAQNAADSMPGGGKVLLRARGGVAEMGRQQRRAVVMLDVIDHGQGISPETQRRLFDPFFTTKEGGTGLGLAIASRIIERNGGLLQFSTRQHSGTTFTIVLPQASLQAEHESPHSAN